MARNYIAEVIVFERTRDSEQREEQWRPESNQVSRHQSTLEQLEKRSKTPTTLSSVSRLKRLQGALQSAGNRILQSGRWVLNARTYQNATTFNLSTDKLRAFLKIYKTSLIFADMNMGVISNTPSPQATSVPSSSQTSSQTLSQASSQTSGAQFVADSTISPSVRVYGPPAPLFFINEKRRLKFKEIHYFDHPKFGVILGVWPAS
ncbi:MAG: peptidoglycan binding protein CsiV [Acidiferrobacterales bacterium]|nr:peptidoglycan binding protein CsiV [Acidiferrobacterales bacterium]